LAIIQCTDELFSNASCEAILPIVQQDNFAGLLLSEETINDIQVDGADRKWIATNNGVWLLSADAQKVIYRFDKKNSPLLGDSIRSLLIEPSTGEVFFATELGISSFRSTATSPVEEKTKPFVFPNPVPSGFTGTIAIRNLPENAWVRITELNGRLVHQTRSLGGQAIWNGKNYKGERASSGTYLIFVSSEDNSFQVAGKIFFIK
jgi:ligand-binding sensor domain-containing protein